MFRCDSCGEEYTKEELIELVLTMDYVLEKKVPQCKTCGSVQIVNNDPEIEE